MVGVVPAVGGLELGDLLEPALDGRGCAYGTDLLEHVAPRVRDLKRLPDHRHLDTGVLRALAVLLRLLLGFFEGARDEEAEP